MAAKPKWWPLFTTNFLGVTNDNFLKTLACFVCVAWVGVEYEELLVTAAAAALVLPYVFLSPIAGRWAVIYNKKTVVIIAKALEMGIMVLAGAAMLFQWVWCVLLCILLMGTQSCLFSPAKYGLIRDIGGQEGIAYGTGLMEMVSFLGMLCGTMMASFLATPLGPWGHATVLFGLAALGFLSSTQLNVVESPPLEDKETIRPFKYLADHFRQARTYPGLNGIIMALSVFWFVAGLIQMTLLVFCRRNLDMTDYQTGVALTLAAVGTGLGCFTSGLVSTHIKRHTLVVVTGATASLLFLVIFLVPLTRFSLCALLIITGVVCGLYKVPFDAAIIEKVPGRALGSMLAYSNQVSFLFILAASGAFALLTRFLDNVYIFLFLALVMGATTLYVGFSQYLWQTK